MFLRLTRLFYLVVNDGLLLHRSTYLSFWRLGSTTAHHYPPQLQTLLQSVVSAYRYLALLQVDTLPEMLQLAYSYDADTLIEACLQYAQDHLHTFMMTVGYKQLIEPNPELHVKPSFA